jgi:hypothetical protein
MEMCTTHSLAKTTSYTNHAQRAQKDPHTRLSRHSLSLASILRSDNYITAHALLRSPFVFCLLLLLNSIQDDELFWKEEDGAVDGLRDSHNANDGPATHHCQAPRIDCQSRKTVGNLLIRGRILYSSSPGKSTENDKWNDK